MIDERTDYEKGPELAQTCRDQEAEIAALKKVLISTLSIIEGNRAPEEAAEYLNDCEREVNPDHCFGWCNEDGAEVIEWPDLDLAARDIRKVLA